MKKEAYNLLYPFIKWSTGTFIFYKMAQTLNGCIDGKVSSLNSFLTPDSEYYEYSAGETSKKNNWLADVDGSYGENDNGIFFFTTDGKYIEWTGTYIYSDIPYIVDDPILKVQEEN